MTKIVVATIGSLGDLHPFVAIALELQNRGYRPVMATLACYRKIVEGVGLECHSVRPNLPMDDPKFMGRFVESASGLEALIGEKLLPDLSQSYDDLMKCAFDAAAVIVGSLTYAGPLVAEKCGIPWYSAILSPSYASSGRLSPMRLRHSPALVLAMFSPLLGAPSPDWPAATTVTGFASCDNAQHFDDSDDLVRFLDGGEPPIVFTLGSTAVLSPGIFFQESVTAARLLGKRAVLLLGNNPSPADLACDIAAHRYVPYSALFHRAAAIVHQGGIGTVGQALKGGRPMLIVPQFLDQPDNAVRVRRLGVARILHASAYTASNAVTELRHLLVKPTYAERAREVGVIVRNENGVRRACDAVEKQLGSRAPEDHRGHGSGNPRLAQCRVEDR